MSVLLINDYLREIDRLRQYSGASTEKVISEAFKDLLKGWAKKANLHFIPQHDYLTPMGARVIPDGAVLHDLRVPLGWWEAKDTADDLDVEIAKKLKRGYPRDNIVFENSQTAVLYQNGAEIARCGMTETAELNRLLTRFFAYERPEIAQFRKAVAQFRADLPAVLDALRARIETAYADNPTFAAAAARFLAHAQETINPTLTEADVREMLIQHILTEEIFTQVFNDGDFHRENNIAKELYALEQAFFTGGIKRDTLKGLEPYYAAIRANAAQITSHAEKQTFLKVIYENFYKVYNPKAADRLGVVYTPNEIVGFMIEGAEWLTHKHFGKALIDPGVEILDPATGTGTFICELIEHFRGQPARLHAKYKTELHANEVAILPYYVANLNIEATYAAVAGQYAEFVNLCFVDTLDNVAGLGIKAGHQGDLFAGLSDENVKRVREQNKRKISVIIGNPPYNANQQNENDNNKNRAYPHIDGLIKRSFVKLSTAQKTKVYDMYARFFRWAADRMHDDGVIAFITNRSFIDSRTFDGFRRWVAQEFAEVYVVDLGGDVRANPKITGTMHNVFGIQTGVAISFLVKKRGREECRIHYVRRPEFETSEEKLAWLGATRASGLQFERVEADGRGNWINQNENDWDGLIPVADKKTKLAKNPSQERAIFKLVSLGISTNRDDWGYDFTLNALKAKIKDFVEVYNSSSVERTVSKERLAKIKWTSELVASAATGALISLDRLSYAIAQYRPFIAKYVCYNDPILHRFYGHRAIFPTGRRGENVCANVYSLNSDWPLAAFASSRVPDLNMLKQGNGGTFCLPRYRYTTTGERIDNITDWALKAFRDHYGKAAGVTKDAIFHYVYAALHDPVWRETYAINLKREFPRLPFHPDFAQWADWGARLMDLHVGYEAVEPWPVARTDAPDLRARAAGLAPKPVLKSDPGAGTITLDSETRLAGIPAVAWEYRLGNRSGLDWVLDQHKEKTPKDPTIRARFDTYRFADHKERVADLLARVARVSVETMAIVAAMRDAPR